MKSDPRDELRRVMKAEGVTATELSRRVTADVSRILAGKVSPKWKTVQALFEALGYEMFVTARKRKK